MSRASVIARQAARLFTGTLLARALDLLFYFILASRLGVAGFGRYMFALSFTLLFSALGDLGISTVFTREVSRAPGRTRELLRRCLSVKLALSVVTLLAVPVAAGFGPGGRDSLALVVPLAIAMLLNSTSLLFDGLLRAAGRAGRSGLNLTLQSATVLASGVALLALGFGPHAGAYAMLIGAVVRVGSSVVWSSDLWGRRPDVPPTTADMDALPARSARALLREAAPLALSGIFIALYFRIDSVILRAVQGEAAVGLYAGAYRMFEAFAMLAVTFRSVLFPVMARAADGPAGSLAVLCRKSIRLHLLFTFGIAVFFTFEAPAVVRAVLGPGYAAAAPALAILIWALPGSYMADTLLFLITAQRRQSLVTWAVGIAAVANVVMNLLLVRRFSILGASAATVATEWLSFALLFAMFQRAAPMPGVAAVVWRPLAAGAVLAAALALGAARLPGGPGGLVLAGAGSLVVYALALVALGAFTRADLDVARGLVRGGAARAGEGAGS